MAAEAGLGGVCRNPFQSIVVRAVEMLYAFDEALRLIDRYEQPDAPAVPVEPRAATGHGVTEAPRGMLYHRYELDGDGVIRSARIVPHAVAGYPSSAGAGRLASRRCWAVRARRAASCVGVSGSQTQSQCRATQSPWPTVPASERPRVRPVAVSGRAAARGRPR